MAHRLKDLPRFIVLEPRGGIRLQIHLEAPACELEMQLENERPGRSFIAMVGHSDGTFVQRVRLAGSAKLYFDPQAPGDYLLLLTNPMYEPVVVRLRGREVPARPVRGPRRGAHRRRGRTTAAASRRRPTPAGSAARPGDGAARHRGL